MWYDLAKMVTLGLLILLAVISWKSPKAFSWLLLGPVIGIPIGLTAWTLAIQWANPLFNLQSASAFAAAGWLVTGLLFARCQ